MSRTTTLPALALVLVVAVAACASPGDGASPTPDPNLINHATGPTDLVLRYEEGGGFVPASWLVTQAPVFSLYGDGTVIFRDDRQDPLPAQGPIVRGHPFRIARLSEAQVQAVLELAIGRGGLGVARARYDNPMIADAGTAIFTLNADGQSKRVEIYALGLDDPSAPDAVIRQAFAELAEYLRNFESETGLAAANWEPERFRGTLFDDGGFGGAAQRDWPWPEIAPGEFVSPADDAFPSFPRRELSRDEVAMLELGNVDGGVQGIALLAADGTRYDFALRPLLPDEEA